jgi:hypothetical protein
MEPTTHLDFTTDQQYNPPLAGIYKGRLVKVQASGNTTGMSSTWKIFDEGQAHIVSLAEVRIVDPAFLAPSVEQFRSLLREIQQ